MCVGMVSNQCGLDGKCQNEELVFISLIQSTDPSKVENLHWNVLQGLDIAHSTDKELCSYFPVLIFLL